MTEHSRKKRHPILIRGAVLAGRVAGSWRHRKQVRAQDAFVVLWKTAWAQGCETAWAGGALDVPADLSEPLRAAWTAGWNWAQTQPNRRQSGAGTWKHNGRTGRRSSDKPRLVRAAKGGAAGLVVFAAAKWLFGRDRSGK